MQISTAFTGILDGQGFRIHGATLVGKETGLFKTLGNKAVIRNLVIDNVQALASLERVTLSLPRLLKKTQR